jgi:hypothetical protein
MEKFFIVVLHANIVKDKFHYPILLYNVELWGSWNNWSDGTSAKMEYEMSRTGSGGWSQTINFRAGIKLNKGLYEYKWKFTYNDKNNLLKGHTLWLTDGLNTLTNKHDWNQNNIFEYK